MYPNLNAEMARRNFTIEKMVTALNSVGVAMTIGTFSNKRSGKYPFTFNEAVKIKQVLAVDMSLESLFEEA